MALPSDVVRTIVDMSRDPQINIAVYGRDEADHRVLLHVVSRINDCIQHRENCTATITEPLRVRSIRAMQALFRRDKKTFVFNTIEVVVYHGPSLPPLSGSNMRLCPAFKDRIQSYRVLLDNAADIAAKRLGEIVGEWVWDVLN